MFDPVAATLTLQVQPRIPCFAHIQQGCQERPGIGQQHLVGSAVIIKLFMTAIDTNQSGVFAKKRRVAKIHLIVEAAADHYDDIGLLNRLF